MSSTVLSLVPSWKKVCCSGVPAMQAATKWWSQSRRPIVSTNDRRWDLKKGQRFTLLKRITNYKSVNSESVGGSVLSHRVPSRGSCHLVDSTWVTHLNWNNFPNSDELHRSRQRHQTKKPNPSKFQWKKRISSWCSVLMRQMFKSPVGIRYQLPIDVNKSQNLTEPDLNHSSDWKWSPV